MSVEVADFKEQDKKFFRAIYEVLLEAEQKSKMDCK
jgi:hypothetical protein